MGRTADDRVQRVVAVGPHVRVSGLLTGSAPASGIDDGGEVGTGEVPAPISLVLIDDNRLLREGLATMLRSQPGFTVLVASADFDEALGKVREARPDVVLLDLGLEDHDSVALTAKVHDDVPTARVIVMGLLLLEEDVATYVRAGASGFIMKDASFGEFFETIRAVAGGVQVLPEALTKCLFSQITRNALRGSRQVAMDTVRLTRRERQIVSLVGKGRSNREIGARLHIPIHMVKSHVHDVIEKLALRSRLEVAAFTHAEPVADLPAIPDDVHDPEGVDVAAV
jgi:DNA-binding NarL/FixJ family response regulator